MILKLFGISDLVYDLGMTLSYTLYMTLKNLSEFALKGV